MSNVSVIAAVEALERADLAAADTAICADLLRHVRRARGWLDAVEARISSRARDLATITPEASGPAGTSVSDMHGAIGGTSAAEGRRRERRSKTLDETPSFADALENGRVSAEHVDALANATTGLDDAIKTELLADEESLLAAATSRSPEEFARVCRDRIRRLERDHGISRNRQQRADTYLRRKVNRATGMTEAWMLLHPELANQIFGAVDREIAAMIADGERAGDPEFVNRSYQRDRLAAQALGRLVAGGHDRERPLEADITYIVDADTAATGRLHHHSICEPVTGSPYRPKTCAARSATDAHPHPTHRHPPATPGVCVPCTGTAPTQAATRPSTAARSTTSTGSNTAAQPTSRTCGRSAPGLTTSSTRAAGPFTSHQTAPSPSDDPTATPTPPSDPTSPTTGNDDDPQRDARPRNPANEHGEYPVLTVPGGVACGVGQRGTV